VAELGHPIISESTAKNSSKYRPTSTERFGKVEAKWDVERGAVVGRGLNKSVSYNS
jgi:hypothetical protein